MENTSSMKDKTELELDEILRDTPHASPLHREAQSELDLRKQKELRHSNWTRVTFGAILAVIVLIAYLRTC
jgi:hypothetical protein